MRLARRRNQPSFDDAMFGLLAVSSEKLVAAGISEDEAATMAAEIMLQAADSVAPSVVATVRRQAPRVRRARRRQYRDFKRVLKVYWGEPLNRYLQICMAAVEIGRRFYDRLEKAAEQQQDYEFEALMGLYARACRTAVEIHHAFSGGYSMGALARCRTLHEIAVIMIVITRFREEIPDLAERFLLHDVVQNYKDAKIYQEHCAALGEELLTEAEMTSMEEGRQDLIERFGDDYRHPYGWASGIGGLSNPKFADLERQAGVAHLRGHCSWANHEVHADSKGWRLNILGRGEGQHQATGPDHLDMAEPASWSLISLGQCVATLVFSTDDISPLEVMCCQTVQRLIDDAMNAFDNAEAWAEEADRRVLPLPQWRRKAWLLWQVITKRV